MYKNKSVSGYLKVLFTLLCLTIFLSGCAENSDSNHDKNIRVTGGGTNGEISEQYLKDGTRCAVLLGSYKGGISCDWNGEKRLPSETNDNHPTQ